MIRVRQARPSSTPSCGRCSLVFGVACVGVLVEAFLPRAAALRRPDRPGPGRPGRRRSSAPCLVAATSTVARRRRGPRPDRRRGHDRRRRPDRVPLGPDPGLRASAACCCSPSATSRAGSRRSPARPPRCRAPRPSARRRRPGLDHTEVYPLLMFAVGGMMLFPAANDLLTMFVALEVLSLPLYLLCGLARRRRLLSQEAALKYFLLGAFSSGFFLYGIALIYGFAGSMEFGGDQRGGPQRRRQPLAAADRHGHARGRPALQGRRRAVPGLDPRRLPGRPDRGDRVHGGRHQGRRVRRAAAALLRRLRRRPLDLAADDVDRSRSSPWSSARSWRSSRPT